MKQKEQRTRVTYENGYSGIYVYPETGELGMEEWRGESIRAALQRVGEFSQICYDWEIYKLLFLLHNVKPVWVEVNITNDDYNKVFIIWYI